MQHWLNRQPPDGFPTNVPGEPVVPGHERPNQQLEPRGVSAPSASMGLTVRSMLAGASNLTQLPWRRALKRGFLNMPPRPSARVRSCDAIAPLSAVSDSVFHLQHRYDISLLPLHLVVQK